MAFVPAVPGFLSSPPAHVVVSSQTGRYCGPASQVDTAWTLRRDDVPLCWRAMAPAASAVRDDFLLSPRSLLTECEWTVMMVVTRS